MHSLLPVRLVRLILPIFRVGLLGEDRFWLVFRPGCLYRRVRSDTSRSSGDINVPPVQTGSEPSWSAYLRSASLGYKRMKDIVQHLVCFRCSTKHSHLRPTWCSCGMGRWHGDQSQFPFLIKGDSLPEHRLNHMLCSTGSDTTLFSSSDNWFLWFLTFNRIVPRLLLLPFGLSVILVAHRRERMWRDDDRRRPCHKDFVSWSGSWHLVER